MSGVVQCAAGRIQKKRAPHLIGSRVPPSLRLLLEPRAYVEMPKRPIESIKTITKTDNIVGVYTYLPCCRNTSFGT
jgi:hypothetical protein